MMNKKLIALLLAVSAAANIAAYCDGDGYCDGAVEVADDAVVGTGDAAYEVAAVPGDVVTGIFGGRERREERRNRREDRRDRRAERRAERRGYRN